jgi:acetyl esterase
MRLLAGRPVEVDGQRLATTAQVLIRLSKLAPFDYPHTNGSIERARREMNAAGVLAGSGFRTRVRVSDHLAKGIPLRLYEPEGLAAPGPGLVFFHGGGFVMGSIDTHDGACRYLATEADVRVVSVEYRLAPEHRFPAAVEDAMAAFAHVRSNPADFGLLPGRIAVGGDSSGGNLAAVVAHAGARGEIPGPAFSLLLNPATDAHGRHPSQELFGLGFRLDTAERDWYRDRYLVDLDLCRDPRASVIYDDQLTGLPPTYIATSGFDPLRDEGEAYARRLADAGVPVILRRHTGLLHGFASRAGVDPDARAALQHAAGVLRAGLALKDS